MKIVKTTALALIALSLAGCGVSMLPLKDPWYAQHYFILQDFERKAYHGLTPNGRLEFQKIYWTFRSQSAEPEFDRRLQYINATFKQENSGQPWNTDRARVYLLNGSPASVDRSQNDSWVIQGGSGGGGVGAAGINDRSGEDVSASTLEVWTYPFDRFMIAYGFSFQQPNKWKAVTMTTTGARYISGLETMNKTGLWGPLDEGTYRTKLEELKGIK